MKRYHDYCDGKMRESDDGDWVRFEDAQAEFQRLMDASMQLKAELVRKDAQIEELTKRLAGADEAIRFFATPDSETTKAP